MSDTPLTAEQIAYKATVHDCGWAEHHINLLVAAREQAARLEALDEFDALLSQISTDCLASSKGTKLGEGVEIGRRDVRDWLVERVAALRAGEPKAQGQGEHKV